MTLDDKVWTLLRDQPDFSPLDFRQRYIGNISDDGRTIVAAGRSVTTAPAGNVTSICRTTGCPEPLRYVK